MPRVLDVDTLETQLAQMAQQCRHNAESSKSNPDPELQVIGYAVNRAGETLITVILDVIAIIAVEVDDAPA